MPFGSTSNGVRASPPSHSGALQYSPVTWRWPAASQLEQVDSYVDRAEPPHPGTTPL